MCYTGNYDTAHNRYLQQRNQLQDYGLPRNLPTVLLKLAVVAEALQQFQQALGLYHELFSTAQKLFEASYRGSWYIAAVLGRTWADFALTGD